MTRRRSNVTTAVADATQTQGNRSANSGTTRGEWNTYDFEYILEHEYDPDEFGGGAIDINFKKSMKFNNIVGDINRYVCT